MRVNQISEKMQDHHKQAIKGMHELSGDQYYHLYKFSKNVAGHDGKTQTNGKTDDEVSDKPFAYAYTDEEEAMIKGADPKAKKITSSKSEEVKESVAVRAEQLYKLADSLSKVNVASLSEEQLTERNAMVARLQEELKSLQESNLERKDLGNGRTQYIRKSSSYTDDGGSSVASHSVNAPKRSVDDDNEREYNFRDDDVEEDLDHRGEKYQVTVDHHSTNKDVPLYTKTYPVYGNSEEEAIGTVRKLVGGRNHRIEQGVAEGQYDIPTPRNDDDLVNVIPQLYGMIYDQGDDALDYLDGNAPVFSKFWDQYEGDLDSIMDAPDVGVPELRAMYKELSQAVDPHGLGESAPKGWEGTVKAMKKHKDIDNPYALTNYMKNKGYTSHKKESIEEEISTEAYDRLKKIFDFSDFKG